MTRIIGIDPGLRYTGWGVIESTNNHIKFVASGRICPSQSLSLPERLGGLMAGLQGVLEQYRPVEVAVEEVFVNVNFAGTLKLGQARGALLATASCFGLPVAEYSAKHVKKALVGTGSAQKAQMIAMVKQLLPMAEVKTEDEADALSVAICHSHEGATKKKLLANIKP